MIKSIIITKLTKIIIRLRRKMLVPTRGKIPFNYRYIETLSFEEIKRTYLPRNVISVPLYFTSKFRNSSSYRPISKLLEDDPTV